MHFKGKKSHIQCLRHVLNLVVKAILADLKARTMKETLDEVDTPSSAIAKLWHMVIWISKSLQRRQQWNKLLSKNIVYNNNTC
jgi:truncated hemoglobin YjbI